MGQEAGECAGNFAVLVLRLDGRGRLSLHYLSRNLQPASHSPTPTAAAILALPTRALPDEHTIAPITGPAEMPTVPAAPADIPTRLLPRKSAAARTEPMCAKWRRVPMPVNGFPPAPSAHSVRRRAMPPGRAACEFPSG